MGEAKVGEAFVQHEFDEAIAIHRAIVEGEEHLSKTHPIPEAKRAIKAELAKDQRFLRQLEKLGKQHGASGKVEDVAASMKQLMEESAEKATEALAASPYLQRLEKLHVAGAATQKVDARGLCTTGRLPRLRDVAISSRREVTAPGNLRKRFGPRLRLFRP